MMLLFLNLLFYYDLFHCDVFEKANINSNGTLTIEHEATRNHNFMKSTPGTDQMNPITPHYSFLPTQIDHGAYIQSPTGTTPRGPSFTKRFPQAIRRNQKIHQIHQGITVLEISKRRYPEAKASSHDPVRRSREPALHRIKRSQTLSTGIKKRLFPNLLLSDGKEIIGYDTNTDEDDKFEKKITLMDAGEEILGIRELTEMTKKLWYSDRMKTLASTTTKQFLRRYQKKNKYYVVLLPTYSVIIGSIVPHTAEYKTASFYAMLNNAVIIFQENTAAHSYFKMIETLQEGYMMVFLIELTRLIATKENKAVRDVVKHTDQIIHGLYQSGQLLLFGKPLINVTRKIARLLKESEMDVIQNHAANLHHMLRQRHQELSVEVNTILEYADMLDDEGRLLFDALKEFAAYPNISLTGYWLCNGLIYNFLRPYRRLKDTQQRQELMDSVNLVLKSNKKTPLRSGDVRQADDQPDDNQPSLQTDPVTQTEPHSDTARSPRERKRKRHNRTHMRKRERKQHRIHRYRPQYRQRYYQKHVLERMTKMGSA